MATIKDVAKKAGVSVAAVSLITNGRPHRLSEETVERVLQVVKEIDYQPNAVARSMITKKSNTLAVLVSDSSVPLFADIIKGLEDCLMRREYSLFLCNTRMNNEREKNYIKLLVSKQIDGLIVFSSSRAKSQSIDAKSAEGIPIVHYNLPEETEQTYSVNCDDYLGGYLAGKYLKERGYHRIGIISGEKVQIRDKEKMRGFEKALEEVGDRMEAGLCYSGDYSIASGVEGAQLLLDQGVDAIFAFGNLMACGVYKACLERGLSIPEDVAVLGYGDVYTSELLPVPLTVISVPTWQIGQALGDKIIGLIQGQEVEHHTKYEPCIVERASVSMGNIRHR